MHACTEQCGCAQPVNEAGSPRAKLDCAHVTRGKSSRHRAVNGVPACSWLGQAYVPHTELAPRVESSLRATHREYPLGRLFRVIQPRFRTRTSTRLFRLYWDSIADGDNRDEMKHACYNSGSGGAVRTFEQTYCEHVVRVSRNFQIFQPLGQP